MQAFSYVPARTISEAAEILAREGDQAKCLSGGTDLIVFLREGRRSAKVVVDVKGIPELNQLSYSPKEGLTIGAAVPCHRIYNNAQIAAAYPGLIDAVTLIGGTAIQGRATLGGNVCTASPAGDSIPVLIAYEATCIVASGGLKTSMVPVARFQRKAAPSLLIPARSWPPLAIPVSRPCARPAGRNLENSGSEPGAGCTAKSPGP